MKDAQQGIGVDFMEMMRQHEAAFLQKVIQALAVGTDEELRKIVEDGRYESEQIDEQFSAEYGQQRGYESLSTNRCGGRSREWFDETGLAFSLGHATSCIVVALFHEDVGIAGSHRNTVTTDDTFEGILTGKAMGTGSVGPVDPEYDSRRARRLEQTLRETVDEAVGSFTLISGGKIPSSGTNVIVYGMSTYDRELLTHCSRLIKEAISSNSTVVKSPGALRVSGWLGHEGEVIYGGPNHPRFNRPALIQYS